MAFQKTIAPAGSACPAASARNSRFGVYHRRRPENTVLHRLVRAHLETFLARAEEADPLCEGCGHDFLVAFSCKGRGVCPSCNARRMGATAAHLTNHVIPTVPVRQWVLSVPKRLRYFLHRDPMAAGAVLHILLRALHRTLREQSPGAGPGARFGAVSFLHRAPREAWSGSSLNPHFHYRLVVLDGAFETPEEEGTDDSCPADVHFTRRLNSHRRLRPGRPRAAAPLLCPAALRSGAARMAEC